jgi:hypothetical protein
VGLLLALVLISGFVMYKSVLASLECVNTFGKSVDLHNKVER